VDGRIQGYSFWTSPKQHLLQPDRASAKHIVEPEHAFFALAANEWCDAGTADSNKTERCSS